jgi:hypothetical protein
LVDVFKRILDRPGEFHVFGLHRQQRDDALKVKGMVDSCQVAQGRHCHTPNVNVAVLNQAQRPVLHPSPIWIVECRAEQSTRNIFRRPSRERPFQLLSRRR